MSGLERARVSASGVEVRGPRKSIALASFDFSAGPGVHAIVGSADDGAGVALAVLAGAVVPSRGVVALDGVDPRSCPERIAFVRQDSPRADPLRVRDAITLAFEVRNSADRAVPSADQLLARFGILALTDRNVASLSDEEARVVALAIALAGRASFVFLEEPLAGLDVVMASTIAEQIEACGKSGASVIVATASRREAVRLGARTHRLVRGASMDKAHDARAEARFVISASDAPALAAALATDPTVTVVAAAQTTVRLHAGDAHAASRAIGRAAEAAGVDISSIEADGAS